MHGSHYTTGNHKVVVLLRCKLKGDSNTMEVGCTYTMLEQQQAICIVLTESENCDVRLLMPSSEEFVVDELTFRIMPHVLLSPCRYLGRL